jgi:hypothetical protein
MTATRALHTLRHEAWSALVSVTVGLAITGIFALGHEGEKGHILITGAVAGFAIYLSIAFLGLIFDRHVDRMPERYRAFGHGILFIVGGMIGWLVGVVCVTTFLYKRPVSQAIRIARNESTFLIVTISIVLVVGMMMRTWTMMKRRLEETMGAEKELELARTIQTRLLPPQETSGAGFSVAARNLAARYVAGDLYDVISLHDGSVVIAVADVAGKGVGASLIMASVKAALPFVAERSLQDAMTALNDKLVNELAPREFVALTLARYYPSTREIHIANAGCPDPYRVSSSGVEALQVPGIRLPLGIRRGIAYGTLITKVVDGDRFLFVSDGIPEAPTSAGEPLGYERLPTMIRSASDSTTQNGAWLDAFLASVRRAVVEPISDDWTAVLLQT